MSRDQREPPQANPNPNPSLEVKALLREDICLPSASNSAENDGSTAGNMDSLISAQLTHLEIIPPAPEQGTREQTYPTIMATFATIPSSSAVMMDATNQYPNVSSIICRWIIKPGPQNKLSACFDQLNKRKKSTSAIGTRVSQL